MAVFGPRVLFMHVQLDRLLDAGDPLVTFVQDGARHLANGREARSVDADAVARRNLGAAIDRVVVGDRVFLIETDDRPVRFHMHIVIEVAAVADEFVCRPRARDAVGNPRHSSRGALVNVVAEGERLASPLAVRAVLRRVAALIERLAIAMHGAVNVIVLRWSGPSGRWQRLGDELYLLNWILRAGQGRGGGINSTATSEGSPACESLLSATACSAVGDTASRVMSPRHEQRDTSGNVNAIQRIERLMMDSWFRVCVRVYRSTRSRGKFRLGRPSCGGATSASSRPS